MKQSVFYCMLCCGMAHASSFSSFVNRSRSEAELRIANGTIRSAAIRLVPGWSNNTVVEVQLLNGGYNFRSHKVSNGTHTFYLRWTEGDYCAEVDAKNRMKAASAGLAPQIIGHDGQAVVTELLPDVKNFYGWAAFERRPKETQLALARKVGAAIAKYHQIPLDAEEMEAYHNDTLERKKRRANITASTFALVPGALDAVERADRRKPSPGIGTQIVFGHRDWHPRNMVMGKEPNGSMKLYIVDNTASTAWPAAWDFGYFMQLWTVFGEEDGALMPGVSSPAQALNRRDNPSNPFFGRSNYPSLAIRRTIAAEYLRRWNKSTDQASCDAFVWSIEVDGPAFWAGVESSSCVWMLQHLQDTALQNPSNETLIKEKVSHAQWDCEQLGLRSKIVEAALDGNESLRTSIMENGLERTSVFATRAGDFHETTQRSPGMLWV